MMVCETLIKDDQNCLSQTICPFVRKTAESIFSDLEKARQEIENGEGVSANLAMSELSSRYGFI